MSENGNKKNSLKFQEPAAESSNVIKITEKNDEKEKGKDIIKIKLKYEETPYRWFFLVSFCLCSFANQMQWVTFSSIASDFSKNYEIATWKVNMFALMYMIMCIVTSIPESWLINSYSIRIILIIAGVCNIIGSGLKLLINKDSSLACCYVGQAISGLFASSIMNAPGKIAANWFREDIRTVICTICLLSATSSSLVGFLWNLMFIKKDASQEDFKKQTFNYILSEFIINIVFSMPIFFVTKDRPDIPPSPSQVENTLKSLGLIESLKSLFSNVKFIFLLTMYIFICGYFDIMTTIINNLLQSYSISGNKSSVIYAISSVFGMGASLIISRILDKTKKFKLIMIILAISGSVFQGLFTLLLELAESKDLNKYAIGLIVYSLISMVFVSVFSISINYACEITYPISESLTTCIMSSSPQTFSIGMTFLCDYFINHHRDKKWITNLILLLLFVLSIIFVFLLDEKLNRQEVEKAGRAKDINDNSENNNIVVEVKRKIQKDNNFNV